jgi:hypothetical protein
MVMMNNNSNSMQGKKRYSTEAEEWYFRLMNDPKQFEKERGSLGQSSTSNDGTSSSSARNDYKNFQNCLSDAEGTKGYATEKEVGDCFNPIYNTGTSGSGGSSDSSSDNDNSDSNSPRS